MWFSAWFGALLKSYLFMVNDGNDDKDDLINPAKYGLENTENVYFPSLDRREEGDRLGAWFNKPVPATQEDRVTASAPGEDSCSSDGCADHGRLTVGKPSKADTVFILLHVNAKN